MRKRFMELLLVLAREVMERQIGIEDALIQVQDGRMDVFALRDELLSLERTGGVSAEEADATRSMLVSMFMNNTDLEPDDIYAAVFNRGRRVLWH